MSTTLSTTAMVALLQAKTGIGYPSASCMDRLNEAFRKINQSSKGGFVWQQRSVNLGFGAGLMVTTAPNDFDPGKQATLYGPSFPATTSTTIPYMPLKDFVNENHFQTTAPGFYSSWTFYPSWTNLTAGGVYVWSIQLAPPGAAIPGTLTLPFFYHSVNIPQIAYGANYFPTPDQFDSLIVDLAWAEVADIYRLSDADKIRQRAMQAVMEIIDTYRSDRYDLAGVTDVIAQAQEKTAENAK